jgi:hypothetical protein
MRTGQNRCTAKRSAPSMARSRSCRFGSKMFLQRDRWRTTWGRTRVDDAKTGGWSYLRDQLGGCLRRPKRHPAWRRREARCDPHLVLARRDFTGGLGCLLAYFLVVAACLVALPPLPKLGVVPQFEICESARRSGSREHKIGEYSDRVKADIVSDNFTRKVLYLIFAVITVIAVFLLGGFAILAAVLGLGPVLVLIVVIEIYCRIQNWRRLRVAEDADADLDKLRPKKSTEVLTVDAIHKLRSRAQQAQDAGEPWLAADLRLAIATLERLDREAALARRPAPGGLAPEPIQPI